jgi:phage replication-related protein YjqB (UPF0714/DUF867 family)
MTQTLLTEWTATLAQRSSPATPGYLTDRKRLKKADTRHPRDTFRQQRSLDRTEGADMADKYRNFAELARNERSGIDYRVLVRRAAPAFAILTPHGGGIEPGTSEIADAIACEEFSFYAFEGLKSSGNTDLHITSTRFDEPMCLTLLENCAVVVTLHGEHSEEDGEGVFLGGLDDALGGLIRTALSDQGFDVAEHTDPKLRGREKKNVCNRGTSGAGVQLELSRAVRKTMFESLTREGRKHPTERFGVFVDAVRKALG